MTTRRRLDGVLGIRRKANRTKPGGLYDFPRTKYTIMELQINL
jgi:hypothetical protein